MLKEYQKKRRFLETPEPQGEESHPTKAPIFVVQRHEASHLHYDFRLESHNVLKSWAVPKGPPTAPRERRLAMMVEDHPLEYANFEGSIPKGNYGAGNVEIWDKGNFDIDNFYDKKIIDKKMDTGLNEGKITFHLHGQKLNGEYALVKLKKSKEKNAWLMIKSTKPEDKSEKQNIAEKESKINKPDPKPEFVPPMMATLIKEPFDDQNWFFEVKWDGYRTIALVDNGEVILYSRNKKTFNKKFAEIAKSLSDLTGQFIFDGEIVALDNNGVPIFQFLQNYERFKEGHLYYYVFDLLFRDGLNLENSPFDERRHNLENIPLPSNIRLSAAIRKNGKNFFQEIRSKGLEGMVAKKADSLYSPGVRSKSWLKIKTDNEQEAVIGGFTEPRGGRPGFGSLLLGVYSNNKLIYIGAVGAGFDDNFLRGFRIKLDKIRIDHSPFINPPKRSDLSFVEAKYVCMIKFREWTSEGVVRQPVFLGIREDKEPREVIKERPETR